MGAQEKEERREENANNFCLILAIKHALDSNLAKCLIIKFILGLDCITVLQDFIFTLLALVGLSYL